MPFRGGAQDQGAYWVKTKSRALIAWWQGKQVLSTAASAGLPSSKCANPQPPVAAYVLASLTINCTPFLGGPATNDWGRPKTLLFSSDAS